MSKESAHSDRGVEREETPKMVRKVKVVGLDGTYVVRMEPGNIRPGDLENILPMVLFTEKQRVSVKPAPRPGTWQEEKMEKQI